MSNESESIVKIRKLKLSNFASFTDFEVEFSGGITKLVGVNGSGKTTIGLTAIWACLKGIAEKNKSGQLIGERFRFIGNKGPSADLELTLFDELTKAEIKVKNHLTSDANHITFESSGSSPLSYDWLSNLLSAAFLSAKNFSQLGSKEQALLLGIDTSNFDSQLKSLKEEYSYVNRDLRSLGEILTVEKVDPVSISDLLAEKKKLEEYNSEQQKRATDLSSAQSTLISIRNEINAVNEWMESEVARIQETAKLKTDQLNERLEKGKKYITGLPQAEKMKDVSALDNAILNAELANQENARYNEYVKKTTYRDNLASQLNSNKEKQLKVINSRLEFIKSFNFGFEGLSVDDSGGLLLDGRPLKEPYFSRGELEMIVAKLYASKNPEFRVRFVDDFEALDEDNQVKLLDELLAKGFQVITAEVGKVGGDNTILLRECKIVKSYDDPKPEQKTL